MTSDGRMVNAYVPGSGKLDAAEEALIARRAAALGPAYRLFYEHPLQIVRGEDVWLHAADGRRYLDAYNNVASVGHCHPHVVEAIARQAATLSTHTRYLSEGTVAFAERLLATFPREIGHVMFTCTGSEANDLAVRLARNVTGAEGFLITANAYHGVTEATAGLSPSLGPAVPRPRGVRLLPAPLHGDGEAFAADVRAAIASLAADGIRPAALIVDTIFSSDGVIPDPAGFLAPAVAAIRAAGGLFIADEVQPGFGRTGAGLWGFSRHGVVPDMVSMGKPMGNGYPVAALAMKPEMVADFGARARYFNTFGGNSVAIAAASAVLDVIENQNLIANARDVGVHFKAGLLSLKAPQIAAVRGVGLFLGVDIAREAKADAKEAARLVNGLREAGVLISATGPNGNILKIRPPLTFTKDQADWFLERFATVLTST